MVVPQTEIIIRKGGAEVARRVVEPGEYLIGRGEDCAFQVQGEKVSRHHARLFVSFQDWSVADLGSANGTQLNDEPVGEAAVKVWPSQVIRVGDATIELRALATSDPDATLMPAQQTVSRHLPPELQGARRYQIGKQVAQGGMGAILDAVDVSTRRSVAMKVMLSAMDQTHILRFIEEAQVTAQLEHPNIVPVHELAVNEQGEVFYTMKMVHGVTLKKVLELLGKGVAETAKKYPLPVLLTVFQKVCDAIAFAHSKGVIHRDLKPENIMLGEFGEVLVMDWGLARLVGSKERESVVRTAKADEGDAMRTQTGSIMGTPAYMSPEQARGEIEKLDARSDIYALGTILFEILHLRPAVTGAEVMQIVNKVQRGEIEWSGGKSEARISKTEGRSAKTEVPDSLLAVCRKALALAAAKRYARIEDLQADLLAYQNGFATSAENAGAWKQLTLFIKRHKAASIGVAAVLIVGSTLGAKAIIEAQKAKREGERATAALANLKKQAPALIALAETESGFQRFQSALEKLDAALELDPTQKQAYWLRAWSLMALDRWSEAAAALILARERDPAGEDRASILPIVEQLAAAPEDNVRWTPERCAAIYAYLDKQNAAGPLNALTKYFELDGKKRERLIRQRLDEWLGKNVAAIQTRPDGTVRVAGFPKSTDTLEPLRGLPINHIVIGAEITSIEALREMPLRSFGMDHNRKLKDLTPLKGRPLTYFSASYTAISDISPLAGAALETFYIGFTQVQDISALKGMPLSRAGLMGAPISDYTPLAGAPLRILGIKRVREVTFDLKIFAAAPLEELVCDGCGITDLNPLRGKPLRRLSLSENKITDLSPLVGLPLVELEINSNPITDFTPLLQITSLEKLRLPYSNASNPAFASLRQHPSLKFIVADKNGGGPFLAADDFWAQQDAKAK